MLTSIRSITPFALVLTLSSLVMGGELEVVATTPSGNELVADVATPIVIEFDRPLATASVTSASLSAFGRWSGSVSGTFSFSNGDQTVTLTPDDPFSPGETVMVILSHDLEAADGSFLRSAGYSFQFWTRAQPAELVFEEIDVMTTRSLPNVSTRAYGGAASDLDNDGWLDLSIMCEDSADVRIFMNLADGTGLFTDFLIPPTSVGNQVSPNEPADFNRDGNVDLCTCNIADDTVSILLGNGDGTFQPQQLIAVGNAPRGIAVLDVDGDGDVDIVNTNANDGNLSLLINDGNGVFGAPSFFEGGGSGEWALAAADMNEDGILDLVIGARNGQEIIINAGNGDGTFTEVGSQSNVGSIWMLVCGDVNGDGHVDVATADSTSNHGSILLGDGAGDVGPPVSHGSDPFPLASDLGDLDGDGDLDWMLASFSGDWRLLLNDGDGNFTFETEFPAPDAASCSLMFDFDNDGDLDLALVDELDDVVILLKQEGPIVPAPTFIRGDIDGDDQIALDDAVASLDFMFLMGSVVCVDTVDIDDSGDLTLSDPLLLLAYLFQGGPPPALPWPECGPDVDDGDALDCAGPYPACP